MNTLDGKLLVDRGRFLLYETLRVVVPFIMEINLGAKDEHTHVVIFEDILRKPMLICDNCVSYYDNYKMRQMLGVSKVMTLDEYVGW